MSSIFAEFKVIEITMTESDWALMNSKLICNTVQSLSSWINLTFYTLYKQPFVTEK